MTKKTEFLKSIRTLSATDLKAKIADSQLRLKKLSFSHKVTPLENPKMLKNLRKDIARMHNELTHLQ